MDFLPANYDIPQKGGSYMKLVNGVNHFRILAAPILGYEVWEQDGDSKKPRRFKLTEAIPTEYADSVKHFWAMPVWNYKEDKIQILELTQKTIMRAIKGLAADPDWGSPLDYDLSVNRTGEDLQSTEYTVQPKPKRPLPSVVADQWDKIAIDMNLLYSNGDPFSLAGHVDAETEATLNDLPF